MRGLRLVLAAAAARARVVVHVSSYGRRAEKVRTTLSSLLDQTHPPDIAYHSHACRDAARSQRLGCGWRSVDSAAWRRLCGSNCSDDGRGGPSAVRPRPPRRLPGLDLPRGHATLDELAHSTYGYAAMRYENRGRRVAPNGTRRVLAGSTLHAFRWSRCVPETVGRLLDALDADERFFDDPIISSALRDCGAELLVVPCGEEPINREDAVGDYEAAPVGRSATLDRRDALNIGVYKKLFFDRRRKAAPRERTF
ncbi:hypothetical protein JL720_8968 [Aureococcus anophagefferens]|nr:hypothetical protein JL720_8968 [Aureococcus anophagefferens]